MSLALPRTVGERVWFLASHVPVEIRVKAAEKVIDGLVRDCLGDFDRVLIEAAALRAAADEPRDEEVHSTSVKEWLRVVGEVPNGDG